MGRIKCITKTVLNCVNIKNMKTTGRRIELNGLNYLMESEAWWLDRSVKREDGTIEVARVDATGHLRYRSPSEIETHDALHPTKYGVNPYHTGPDFSGNLVSYMLGLTIHDLHSHSIAPGNWSSANEGVYRPIPQPTQKMVSQCEHDKDISMIMNEWYGDGDELYENPRYFKGKGVSL